MHHGCSGDGNGFFCQPGKLEFFLGEKLHDRGKGLRLQRAANVDPKVFFQKLLY